MNEQPGAIDQRRRSLLKLGLALPAMALAGRSESVRAGPPGEYTSYDGLGLAQLVASGETTAGELLTLALRAIARLNPTVNAVTETYEALARSQIEAGVSGPFAGVPFLLKDLHLAMAGTASTSGSAFFRGAAAERDSELVRRYRQAGLVLAGRTAVPELAMTGTTESRTWGLTRNPWNLELTAGGSSGGAAAAVAAGMVPMANGSDGLGSIRTPASCCGLFGLKPTRGRVPLDQQGWMGLSTAHALTRTVRDSAALLDATAGFAPGQYFASPPIAGRYLEAAGRDPEPLKIALMTRPPSGSEVEPACLAAADDAAKLCESLGHHVEEAAPTLDAAAMNDAVITALSTYVQVATTDRARTLGREPQPDDLEPVNWMFLEIGRTKTAADYERAYRTFQDVTRRMAAFHDRYDVLLSPTLGMAPVALGTLSLSPADIDQFMAVVPRFGPFTGLANMAGTPSMSVPLAQSQDDVPIGTMFGAAFGREDQLFSLAGQLERATQWFRLTPAMDRKIEKFLQENPA
ncbi:MAG: amidase [Pseudomonadota bacterium]